MLEERKYTAALGAVITMIIYFAFVLDEQVYAFVRLHIRSYNIFIYALGVIFFSGAAVVLLGMKKLVRYLTCGIEGMWRYITVHSLAIVILSLVVLIFNIVFDNIHSIRGICMYFLP